MTNKTKPLTGKYAKLRDDLIAALDIGAKAETGEDGGTCNVDAPAILLPRWTRNLVKRAAREAGTECFEWNLYGSRYFVFQPRTRAIGNDRSRNAEAATSFLESCGYERVICYSEID